MIMSGIIDRHTLMASSRIVKIKDNEGRRYVSLLYESHIIELLFVKRYNSGEKRQKICIRIKLHHKDIINIEMTNIY